MNDTPQNTIEHPIQTQKTLMRMLTLCRVFTGLIVMVLVINALLNLSTDLWPNWLPRKMTGNGFHEDITNRVHKAQQAYAKDPTLTDSKLCVIMGLSSQREAAELSILNQLDGIDARYLGLCGAGPSLSTIKDQCSALFSSDLKPDLAVIGINLHLQVDPLVISKIRPVVHETEQSKSLIPILSPLLKGDLRKAYGQTRERAWFHVRRRDVSIEVKEKLYIVNNMLLTLFGTTNGNSTDDLTSPWREMIHIGFPAKASSSTFTTQIQSYTNRGLFDVHSYEPQNIAREHQALNDIISTMQARGTKVMIILMPEHSLLRKSIPDVAMTRLEDDLLKTFGNKAPQIINMRDALPDEDFSDIAHVNSSGRKMFSKLIAPILAEQMQ